MSITASGIQDQIEALRSRGEEFCVATVVRTADATSAKAGAKAVVARDGTISGFVGGGCVQGSVRKAAAEVLETGEARLIRVKPRDTVSGPTDADGTELHGSACPSGGTVELFIEPMLLAPRLVVMGASPVAAALVALAGAMSYRTVVACPEAERGKVPGAGVYLETADFSGALLTGADAVVVATQGKGDLKALEAALSSGVGHVAFVGSHKKAEALRSRLRDGASRFKAPAGLDIGAIEPEEIALSIFAEIISWRRGRLSGAACADQNRTGDSHGT
ncbi:MAG: XdhC family protein [Pseudomonadota bacterium]